MINDAVRFIFQWWPQCLKHTHTNTYTVNRADIDDNSYNNNNANTCQPVRQVLCIVSAHRFLFWPLETIIYCIVAIISIIEIANRPLMVYIISRVQTLPSRPLSTNDTNQPSIDDTCAHILYHHHHHHHQQHYYQHHHQHRHRHRHRHHHAAVSGVSVAMLFLICYSWIYNCVHSGLIEINCHLVNN